MSAGRTGADAGTDVGIALLCDARYADPVARPVPQPATELTAGQKLSLSLRMFDYGCAIMRETLKRGHPDADDAMIEELLRAWLRQRPGAEGGDCVGRQASWPRDSRGTDA